ncbi:MAG TPA: 5-methylcytosine-specific restriction endonuclease system specificity protein McrC [Allosphingosinicella sp.]|nr:5-methylcytosine-specific restriction endonuclease system specificity protein McrC [Allosphingosinicella sp.]
MASAAEDEAIGGEAAWHSAKGIPVRNLWMLLVYAADLAGFVDRFDSKVDESAELPELLARLLIFVVERRLRYNLSRGYQGQALSLSRVRGRIDWLRSESKGEWQRGRIACRFEDLVNDTPRNRLVRNALEAMQARISDRRISGACGQLAGALAQAGVSSVRPSRTEMSQDQIARHQADDRLMVSVAELTLDMVLPSEKAGRAAVTRLERQEHLLRRIFEKSVAGFYRHELRLRDGWTVRNNVRLTWHTEAPTPGLPPLLPGMEADLILDHESGRRIVVDTKFTGIITPRRFRSGLKSGHLYQLYAYIRSQSGRGDGAADAAEGLLLHPALDRHVDESVLIQGHRLRFATVDLSAPSLEIRKSLLAVVETQP